MIGLCPRKFGGMVKIRFRSNPRWQTETTLCPDWNFNFIFQSAKWHVARSMALPEVGSYRLLLKYCLTLSITHFTGGRKCPKFGLDFRSLKTSGFDIEQYIGNISK